MATSGSRSPKSATTASWRATRRADRAADIRRETKNPGASSGVLHVERKKLLRLCRGTEIQRRKFNLRNIDLDLVQIDVQRLVEQARNRDRKSNHQGDHDRLQADPGQ